MNKKPPSKDEQTALKVELLRLGIKQSEIARRLGVSHGTVCKYLNGWQYSPRVDEYLGLLLNKRRPA